jgi:PPK2 family polyphosphate:nucleotide phosphotransferase
MGKAVKRTVRWKLDDFRVAPGKRPHLQRRPTTVDPLYRDEQDARRRLKDQVDRTAELQDVLYAQDHYSLLLIFQAMDAAGKDGAIKHVMSGVNPVGCQVSSFKVPGSEELDHDFLWRTALRLPERGRIGIFNRSYYEEVLVVRVHPEYLESQRLPGLPAGGPDHRFWEQRYRSIRDHESHLHRNGTVVVKFYLHVSKEEQRKRFIDRIEHPDKNWKFSLGDVRERAYWDDYMLAYEDAMAATSTADAPWYVIPADDKSNARLLVSSVVNHTLESLGLHYPKQTRRRSEELKEARRLLRKS